MKSICHFRSERLQFRTGMESCPAGCSARGIRIDPAPLLVPKTVRLAKGSCDCFVGFGGYCTPLRLGKYPPRPNTHYPPTPSPTYLSAAALPVTFPLTHPLAPIFLSYLLLPLGRRHRRRH